MDFARIPLRRSLTGALMFPLCNGLIALYEEYADWNKVRQEAIKTNLAQMRVLSSTKRLITEALSRVKTLSAKELQKFSDLSLDEKKIVLWIALCRSNLIVAAFGFYLLNEGSRLGKSSISISDYETFYMHLSDEYPEFKEQSDYYHKRMRETIFSSAKQAGLLEANSHRIIRHLVSQRLLALFSQSKVLS